jgi:hypothetical protein
LSSNGSASASASLNSMLVSPSASARARPFASLGERLADDVEGHTDQSVVAGRPGGLLAGFQGCEIGNFGRHYGGGLS